MRVAAIGPGSIVVKKQTFTFGIVLLCWRLRRHLEDCLVLKNDLIMY